MARFIELRFVEQDIAVRARLLEEEMPRTCSEIIKHLPIETVATHARYSGSEIAMLLSTDIKIEKEKATCVVETGDVGYMWLNRDDHYGLDDDVSEICWFYDKDGCPTMAEGPVRTNIFAKIEGDAQEFYKASANTRITGVKNVRISLIEE
ncbi:hypothetical protein MNBD_BACTEROID01-226 [hydrothermal vent metagenome]|uniref:DUF3830 domain-containing protein n=1 Tax=hydrothermal vent metagenome TaxID=652676 RepID=A0A3B0T6C5_9ZZZZ